MSQGFETRDERFQASQWASALRAATRSVPVVDIARVRA